MTDSTDFFAVGAGLLGIVGGVLASLGITIAHPATLAPAWLQALGLSAVQFQLVLAVVFAAGATLAFAEDANSSDDYH